MKYIQLSKGKEAIVDDSRYEELNRYKWYVDNGYAKREVLVDGKRVRQLMHRHIIGAVKGEICDHINGNRLDNRRSNLRIVSYSQNAMNKGPIKTSGSGYRGVYIMHNKKKWIARVEGLGKCRHIGVFETKEEAAKAYNKVALQVYGEYARLNEV